MKNKELGFNRDNIIVLPLLDEDTRQKVEILKTELLALPEIFTVTASSEIPIRGFTSNGYFPEGHKNVMMIHVVDIDDKFLDTYNVPLISGRNFSKEFSTDNNNYLINETLAKQLGWSNPIGKIITRNGQHNVIGVVKDFHFSTLYNRIEPLILTNRPWRDQFSNLSVKYHSDNIPETLSKIGKVWSGITQTTPFEYYFLDDSFNILYKGEQRFQLLFFYFCIIAFVIALLGLYSLASFSTERRTKEIGIRRVFGASVIGITNYLSKEFLILVIIANLIAWPVAWFTINRLFQLFAYKISIGFEVFLISGLASILIALFTISSQTLRAARSNPIKALRYE